MMMMMMIDDDMMFTILSKTICLFQRYIVSTFILISMYTIAVERTGISTYWVSFILIKQFIRIILYAISSK